jgi:hypothetical protein
MKSHMMFALVLATLFAFSSTVFAQTAAKLVVQEKPKTELKKEEMKKEVTPKTTLKKEDGVKKVKKLKKHDAKHEAKMEKKEGEKK